MRKTIAVDMDEVIADLLGHWIEAINEYEGESLKREEILDWDMTKYVSCGKKVYTHLTYDLFRNLPVIKDSQRVVKELMKEYEVYIVSTATNHPESMLAKLEWLKEHFPFISSDNVVLCGNKRIINTDFMIDDGMHNLESFKGTGILFDAPHNRLETEFMRVKSWNDIEEYLLRRK